jgi:hypothetical protein
MGRIRTTRKKQGTVVIIEGRLTAADMRRLEHACAEELTASAPRLEIDMTRVTSSDDTALAVLARLAARGAVLRTAASAPTGTGGVRDGIREGTNHERTTRHAAPQDTDWRSGSGSGR